MKGWRRALESEFVLHDYRDADEDARPALVFM